MSGLAACAGGMFSTKPKKAPKAAAAGSPAPTRLTYFDLEGGRGNPARIALSIGGYDFEDERLTFAQWPERKPHTRWGTLPEAEIAGETYGQGTALVRYAGRLSGLYPDGPGDALAALRVDELLDAAEDVRILLFSTPNEEAARAELAKDKLPPWLARLDKAAAAVDGPFLAGADMTVADLAFYDVVGLLGSGFLDGVPPTIVSAGPYPALTALAGAVAAHPGVAAWEAKRAKVKAAAA